MQTSWCRQGGQLRGTSGCWRDTCTGMRARSALRWRAAIGGLWQPPESICCPLSEVRSTQVFWENVAHLGLPCLKREHIMLLKVSCG